MYLHRAFHLQAISLFKDAAEYDSWLNNIKAPVLAIAGDKDALTPMVKSLLLCPPFACAVPYWMGIICDQP